MVFLCKKIKACGFWGWGSAMACGYKGDDRQDYQLLYFVNPVMNINLTVCIDECPSFNSTVYKPEELNCKNNSYVDECREKSLLELVQINAEFDWENWEEDLFDFSISIDDTPFFIYNTTSCKAIYSACF
jgi:hypothetical protein